MTSEQVITSEMKEHKAAVDKVTQGIEDALNAAEASPVIALTATLGALTSIMRSQGMELPASSGSQINGYSVVIEDLSDTTCICGQCDQEEDVPAETPSKQVIH